MQERVLRLGLRYYDVSVNSFYIHQYFQKVIFLMYSVPECQTVNVLVFCQNRNKGMPFVVFCEWSAMLYNVEQGKLQCNICPFTMRKITFYTLLSGLSEVYNRLLISRKVSFGSVLIK